MICKLRFHVVWISYMSGSCNNNKDRALEASECWSSVWCCVRVCVRAAILQDSVLYLSFGSLSTGRRSFICLEKFTVAASITQMGLWDGWPERCPLETWVCSKQKYSWKSILMHKYFTAGHKRLISGSQCTHWPCAAVCGVSSCIGREICDHRGFCCL